MPMVYRKGQQEWFAPPDDSIPQDARLDVAVVRMDMALLLKDGIKAEFIPVDIASADVVKMKEIGVSEGDGVFILGFPLQLVGGERNFVIARQGIVARISDLLQGYNKNFLVDTFIFPGNSGGPVILKPELTSIPGTKAQATALLIGLVASFQTYQETAVSQQTGRPRITFEDAGLANVIPVDQIKAAIADAVKLKRNHSACPSAFDPATRNRPTRQTHRDANSSPLCAFKHRVKISCLRNADHAMPHRRPLL